MILGKITAAWEASIPRGGGVLRTNRFDLQQLAELHVSLALGR